MTVAQPSSSTRSPRLPRPASPHAVPIPGFSSPQAIPIYPPWRDSCLHKVHFARVCKNTETAILTPFRINTCKKQGGGGRSHSRPPSHAPRGASTTPALALPTAHCPLLTAHYPHARREECAGLGREWQR